MFKVPNLYRFRQPGHPLNSDDCFGNNGCFILPSLDQNDGVLRCIASDGEGWEHVSASFPDHTPSWEDMCFVKAMFWGEDDCVVQFHPPKEEYINNMQHCLHLWRKIGSEFELPPSFMVGLKGVKLE